LTDFTELSVQSHHHAAERRCLLKLNVARPIVDVAFDWAVVFASAFAVHQWGGLVAPVAVCVIANRQRALGNILHDAGHRNLSRDALVNDALASAIVAPLVFADLPRYRETHYRHHLMLGDAESDPDFLPLSHERASNWLSSFARNALSSKAWFGSLAGHLGDREVPMLGRMYIVVWWLALLSALTLLVGPDFAAIFATLWITSRATVFHLITTFREMCDHVGLKPGGIFSFTRDMTTGGFWRRVIHPRNNGYHLTHHLCPAVPYYRLPAAHALFARMPAYQSKGRSCDAYFKGAGAVTRSWLAGAGA
jgi:fatty acid desaturase